MQQKQSQEVYKGLLNEFSAKPYISVSHQLYPIDDEQEQKENSYQSSDASFSSSEDEENQDQQKTDRKPQKGQMPEIGHLKILTNLSPAEFLEIKKQFGYFDNKVTMTQFVAICLEQLQNQKQLGEQLHGYVKSLVFIFTMIDVYWYDIDFIFLSIESITFDQLSNFLVEMHEILERDQSLFEMKLKQKIQVSIIIDFFVQDKQYENSPIEKIFELKGYEGFAYLEQNLKQIRLVNPVSWEEIVSLSIGSTTIISAYYIRSKNCLMISSNDKFLNFFDLKTHKLIRRFMVPDAQTFIQCAYRKKLLYTGSVNGAIYTWDLERIFSKEFLKAMNKHPDCYKLVIKGHPVQEQDDLTSLLSIESLEFMATGSNDTIIRLYENKRNLSSNMKQLKGHIKGIKALSYCSQYKYLVSCSYDFDVLVWNIYLEHPLAKLVGHEAPLLTILVIQEKKPKKFSLLLSCDAKGVLRVWDPKNFQCIQQISVSEGDLRVKSIAFKSEYNLALIGYKKLLIYQIDQSFDPQLTDDQQITCICVSECYLEAHCANIKVWDLTKGVLKRIFKDVSVSDITAIALDNSERRMFIGTHSGLIQQINFAQINIRMIDVFTGFKLREIPDFNKEVCFLNLLVAMSWSREIRILKDYSHVDKELAIRIIKNAHPSEIVLGAFSEHQMLIVTTSREYELRLWDFEKGNFINKFRNHNKNHEVSALKFLDPYPLLASADTSGVLYIYIMRPHKLENQVAITWKNMFTIMKASQVNCIEHYIKDDRLYLIIGDENGDIRVILLDEMISQLDIRQLKSEEISLNKNPHRFFQFTFQEYQELQNQNPIIEGLADEKCANQLRSWNSHKGGVKQIVLITKTDRTLLMTLANDRVVKIWDVEGNLIGSLRQGVDPNTLTPPFKLKQGKNHRTNLDLAFSKVREELDATFQYKDKLKKAKTVPFRKDDQQEQLTHVESKEIFKTLQEIGKYLDRSHEAQVQSQQKKKK